MSLGQTFDLKCVDCRADIRQLDDNHFGCDKCGREYFRDKHGVYLFLPQKMDQHKLNEDSLHVYIGEHTNWLGGKYRAMERCKTNWAIRATKTDECYSFLEVGAGLGFGSAIIKQLHPYIKVVCSDISPNLLSNKTMAVCELLKVEIDYFVACDGETLPFGDNQFDCVFSAYTLHRMLHPDLFLNEAKRVLKPAGILFVVDEAVARLSLFKLKDVKRKSERAISSGIVINAFTIDDWFMLLENADIPKTSLNVCTSFIGSLARTSNLVKAMEIQLRFVKPHVIENKVSCDKEYK